MAHYTTGLGTIKMDKLRNIDIPIPSTQHQKQIIEEMEKKEALIKMLETSISDAKTNIEIIMNGYLKGTKNEESNEKTTKKKSKDKKEEPHESEDEDSIDKTPKKKSKKTKKKSDDEESREIVEI